MAPFDCSTKAPLLFEIEIVEKVIPAVTKYIARSGKTPETNVFSLFWIFRITFDQNQNWKESKFLIKFWHRVTLYDFQNAFLISCEEHHFDVLFNQISQKQKIEEFSSDSKLIPKKFWIHSKFIKTLQNNTRCWMWKKASRPSTVFQRADWKFYKCLTNFCAKFLI